MPKHSKKTFIILDTHALIHRAFHAMPPLTSPAGEPVGAVYGVANVILKIIKELQPDYVVAAFDRPEPTFRHEQYKAYKAQRKKASDDLIRQFDTVRNLCAAFGIPVFDHAGFEADDVIGTVIQKTITGTNDTAPRVIIVSGDFDLLQLVKNEEDVVVLKPGGSAKEDVLYTERMVLEKYGFSPRFVPDFKGITGDASDNIKGIPGVGGVKATTLIRAYGALEDIYAHLEEAREKKTIGPQAADLFVKYKNDAFESRELARIRTDVPLSFTLADAVWSGVSYDSAKLFFERMGFVSLLSRLPHNSSAHATDSASASENTSADASRATDPKTFFQHHTDARVFGWVWDSATKTVCVSADADAISLSLDELRAHAAYCNHLFRKETTHIASGGKEVLKYLRRAHVPRAEIHFDVRIASWVLDPSLRDPNLERLYEKKLSQSAHTIFHQAKLLPLLQEKLAKELTASKVDTVFFTIEMPLLPILMRMEERGVLIDSLVLKTFSRLLEERMIERQKRIWDLAGGEFNINSPKQLSEVLFEKLGITTNGVRKTEGGERSTRASELVKLRSHHPIAEELLSWREEAKLKSTYVDVLPTLINPVTGRVHTTFNQTGTVTGRLSSQDPNLQNIPIRTSLGQEIRKAFVAPEGYHILSCDYSQIELRIAASLAGDRTMIEAFRQGSDIHTTTAALVNNVKPEEVTPVMRRAAKAINFGILYGMGSVSLAESIGVSRKEAEKFITDYFERFPAIKRFMEETKQRVQKQGYVETLFGRRRYFPLLDSLGWQARREAERMAINAPVQGSDADIVKLAMIHISEKLKDSLENGDLYLMLQVHDELLFEVREEKVKELGNQIRLIMENVYDLAVPLRVEIKYGPDWYHLQRL